MDGSHVITAEGRVAILQGRLKTLGQNPLANRDATADCLWELVSTSDALPPPRQVYLLISYGNNLRWFVLPPLWYEYLDSQVAARLINLGERDNGRIDGPVPTHTLAAAHEHYARYGKQHGLRADKVTYHRQRAKELRYPLLYPASRVALGLAGTVALRALDRKPRQK